MNKSTILTTILAIATPPIYYISKKYNDISTYTSFKHGVDDLQRKIDTEPTGLGTLIGEKSGMISLAPLITKINEDLKSKAEASIADSIITPISKIYVMTSVTHATIKLAESYDLLGGNSIKILQNLVNLGGVATAIIDHFDIDIIWE